MENFVNSSFWLSWTLIALLQKPVLKIFSASFQETSFFQTNINFFTYKKKCLKIQLSNEEKNKKQEYGCKRYKILSEDTKQWLFEYRKKYNCLTNIEWLFFLASNCTRSSFNKYMKLSLEIFVLRECKNILEIGFR